jgi:hypothetical protein
MAARTPEASQRLAARIAGFTLLLLIVSGLLSNFVFNPPVFVAGDSAATLRNILAHQRTLRFSAATEIVMFNCDIVLAVALYALLKPVNAGLALMGTFWRSANAIVLGATVIGTFAIAELSGTPAYLAAFSPGQMQGVVKLLLDLQQYASMIGLIFFCLGAGVHSYLLFRSRYIPRILSGLYLFACAELLVCAFIVLTFPNFMPDIGIPWLVPDLIAEISVALWLAFRGASIPAPAS